VSEVVANIGLAALSTAHGDLFSQRDAGDPIPQRPRGDSAVLLRRLGKTGTVRGALRHGQIQAMAVFGLNGRSGTTIAPPVLQRSASGCRPAGRLAVIRYQ
jgi:hypothetical protein